MAFSKKIKQTSEVIKPFTRKAFYKRNSQSQTDIEQGKLVEHEIVKARYNSK